MNESLDQAFEALKTYDWGTDPAVLRPIDEAIVATHGDREARKALEDRLSEALQGNVPHAAKDYACRKLKVIGTAASVPALAELLTDAELSHMARYALESMPAEEAGRALRDALSNTSGPQKAGVIGSLGVRQDTESVDSLADLLADDDPTVAAAAAHSLGNINTGSAAKALLDAEPTNDQVRAAATDALLACAEGMVERRDKLGAMVIYRKLAAGDQPKHVRLAATRGMLASRS